nr:hypothetical protein [Tanacetum cinerariifolium]
LEVQRAGLDTLHDFTLQSADMGMGQTPLLCPEATFFAQQLARAFRVAAEKYREAQAQVGHQLLVQPGKFFQSDVGKRTALGSLLLLNLTQHTLDQSAGQFQIDRQFDDFGPTAVVLIAEVFPGHLRQIQLDRVVQHLDVII